MKLLNFSIIKLTLCLIIGIVLAHFLDLSLYWPIRSISLLVVIIFVVFQFAKRQFKITIWFGILAFITMIIIGSLIYNFHNQRNLNNHYSKIDYAKISNSSLITFRIHKTLKSNRYNDKYIADLLKIGDHQISGKFLLNVQRDSTTFPYNVDDILLTPLDLKIIPSPLNPNQFDYKAYLLKQNIFHQLFSEKQLLLLVSSKKHTIYGLADSFRKHINRKLIENNFKPNQLAIINALILGQRNDISPEIYQSYVNAGAIHILAVSGLHVGIILLILNKILSPIEFLKKGQLIKVILILFLLWSFAIIAGLTASVTRAVTMFSIIAVAMHLKRPTNIYNTLAISIFVLLLFKPTFLFDIGFQMSYLAVIAIVSIQPIIYNLWHPKYTLINYLWQTLTVTIAAQFGVVPISLYYFHQFPGLFLISNMILIPILGIILGFGILIIILSLLNSLPNILARGYENIIKYMNQLMEWTSNQEAFLFKDVSFSMFQVMFSYFLIFAAAQFIKRPSSKHLRLVLISILCIQAHFMFLKFNLSPDEFIIFNKSRYSILGLKSNSKLLLSHNLDSISKTKSNVYKSYIIQNHIKDITEDSIRAVYFYRDKSILVIDSLGVYNVQSFRPNYILLRNSPRINLNRLIDSLHPELIIADGSNYKSYAKRWNETCSQKKIPFHNTSEKGAFFLK